MKSVPSFVWAILAFSLFYLFFAFGIAPVTEALTETAAPLPSSLVLLYSGMAALGILVFLSVREDRWQEFQQPLVAFLRGGSQDSRAYRYTRQGVFLLLPLLIGWRAFSSSSTLPDPPADPPGIHFNLPNKYVSLENPLPWSKENIRAGGILYTKNCAMCHGDSQQGDGIFARAWQPAPANFRDSGTIAQLDENYLFWRIKTGGPGIPKGAIGYRSAMPVWGDVLTDQEIWQIIMFEYTNSGQEPAKRR